MAYRDCNWKVAQDCCAINTRSTIPTNTYNPARTVPQHNHRPTGRRIAILGAATALAALGITAIMQNTGNESIQAPTAFASSVTAAQGPNVDLAATRTGSATATEAAAMVRPTVNQGPRAAELAAWTDRANMTTSAAAAGPAIPNVR